MQRQIKFRALDLTHRKPNICKVLEFKFYDKRLNYMACEEDSVWVCESDGDGIGVFHSVPISKVILMQYTGLKDKNCKEIYEGDILDFGGLGNVVVKFGRYDNEELYEDNESGYGWYLQSEKYIGGILSLEIIDTQVSLVVIGNIYENPELLEKI